MQYFVKYKRTGEFQFCKSVSEVSNCFPQLRKKTGTIYNRFREKEKNNEQLTIFEWGVEIYKQKNDDKSTTI